MKDEETAAQAGKHWRNSAAVPAAAGVLATVGSKAAASTHVCRQQAAAGVGSAHWQGEECWECLIRGLAAASLLPALLLLLPFLQHF